MTHWWWLILATTVVRSPFQTYNPYISVLLSLTLHVSAQYPYNWYQLTTSNRTNIVPWYPLKFERLVIWHTWHCTYNIAGSHSSLKKVYIILLLLTINVAQLSLNVRPRCSREADACLLRRYINRLHDIGYSDPPPSWLPLYHTWSHKMGSPLFSRSYEG